MSFARSPARLQGRRKEGREEDPKISGTSSAVVGRKRKRAMASGGDAAVRALGGGGPSTPSSSSGSRQQATSAIDLLSIDALRRYLQQTCAPLFGETSLQLKSDSSSNNGGVINGERSAFAQDLNAPASTTVLEQFIADSAARVLQVHYFPSSSSQNSAASVSESSRMEVDSEHNGGHEGPSACRIRVNLGIEYATGKKRGHDVVCFIKRLSAPLTSDFALNHQLQVMTLALGRKRADADKSSETGSSSGENTEEEEDDHSNLLSVVYNYVHQSFGPLVNEYSKVHQPQNELANMSEGARGKKLRQARDRMLVTHLTVVVSTC